MRCLIHVLIGLFVLGSGAAWAHDSGTAKARFESVRGGSVSYTLDMRVADAKQQLALTGTVALGDIAKINAKAASFFVLSAAGRPCATQPMRAEALGIHGVRFRGQANCPADSEVLNVEWVAPKAGRLNLDCLVVIVGLDGAEHSAVLGANQAVLSTQANNAKGSRFVTFVEHGVVHILTGWDHLAFLLVLLLGCGTWRRVSAMVTAFTVAHSITLALGASGWVVISSEIVEPLIAASIAGTACFALWQLWVGRLELPGTAVRSSVVPILIVCGGFGLVHGLGFAGLLTEMLSTTGDRMAPLLAFNLGVEIGQLGAVLVAFPLLITVGRLSIARPAYALMLMALLGLGTTVTAMRVLTSSIHSTGP